MDAQRLWMLLNELASQVGVEVRLERLEDGEGYQVHGGLCRIGGRLVAFVDRKLAMAERNQQLGRALGGMDLEGVFLRPAVREFLSQAGSFEDGE